MGRKRMGETIKYHVKTEKGIIVFTGSIKQISANFNVSDRVIYKAYYEGKKILDQYFIVPTSTDYDTNVSPAQIQEHLWTEDGKRNYEHKVGYPNRYKDSSCVRFTPL